MVRYIFTPTAGIKHPTESELKLLLRHIGHDYLSDLVRLGNALTRFSEGSEDPEVSHLERAEMLKKEHTRLWHVHSVCTALSSLGSGSSMPVDWNLQEAIHPLVNYARQHWETTDISLAGDFQQSCYNSRKAVYLQLFHFLQNAAAQRTTTQIAICTEALPLAEEQQSYLGKNGSNYQLGDPFIHVTVQDNGPGIPESRFTELFAPRDPSSIRGIGLSLVDHVCDVVHGYITVDSTIGKGSMFTLTFAQRKNET